MAPTVADPSPAAADPSPAAPDAPSLIDHLSDGNFAGVKAKMQEHAESAAAAASDLHATALDLHATHVVPGVAAMRDLHEQHIAPHAATAGAALADAHASAHRNLADLHATHVVPGLCAAHMGRMMTGSGVGMDALGSPI